MSQERARARASKAAGDAPRCGSAAWLGGMVLVWGAALAAPPAAAQSYSPGYAYVGAPMSNFLSTSYLTQTLVNDLHTPQRLQAATKATREPDSASALLVPTRGPATMPAKLAAHYPAARQAQAKALFEDLLVRYRGIEKQFGIPRGDLGGALASFLVASWMGLHNRSFPDERFPPVVAQMRSLLASQPELADAPMLDRREMYEQMAILGMLMAGTQMALQQQPDAATEQRLREAARGYLRQFFKADAERVGFGPGGLRLE
ncbi:hypothetical protein CKO44_12815 [Rubrivivax gelatinosus]|uniref:DUF6683 family protein n=1 Tax=Rubrivivax gelatinosus TaxID=28068 RepID=UPI001904BBAC|nr:DUF6683 family protein [Rubrivivax gelatinosus]MBK1614349.1 hypothetical protein [Rubrivivax gelatinosus]